MPIRCQWAGSDPLYVAYHDQEWAVGMVNDHTADCFRHHELGIMLR